MSFHCTLTFFIDKPIYSEEQCQEQRDKYPRCKLMMDACYKMPSALTCVPANLYCERAIQAPFDSTGLNPYDIRKPCAGNSGLCYEEIEAIGKYANKPEVRLELGVDEKAGQYEGCDDSVGYNFATAGDGYVVCELFWHGLFIDYILLV